MRVVVQRVQHASVTVGGEVIGSIERGLFVLVGFSPDSTPSQLKWMAKKVWGLRVFEDADGRMNLGLDDIGADCLVVSQFTLYGDCRKGRRPSFVGAAPGPVAEELYDAFCEELRALGVRLETGRFGADMKVDLCNDGPVTLLIDAPA